MSDQTATDNQSTAIEVFGPSQAEKRSTAHMLANVAANLPANREQLEMLSELMQVEADLEAVQLPIVNSKDLVGVPLTILDASFREINDKGTQKTIVNFTLKREDTGDVVQCGKGSNSFNDVYANFFSRWRAVGGRTIEGMQFVEDHKFSTAGNPAIVLRKIQNGMKSVGKGK